MIVTDSSVASSTPVTERKKCDLDSLKFSHDMPQSGLPSSFSFPLMISCCKVHVPPNFWRSLDLSSRLYEGKNISPFGLRSLQQQQNVAGRQTQLANRLTLCVVLIRGQPTLG
mmetsp:Transcript_7229/g.17600  ORF Transcript_7229/g.17600 Transcript_7229/m.17600 type:complete len:113 (-) Transcript_7229:545-883(-)